MIKSKANMKQTGLFWMFFILLSFVSGCATFSFPPPEDAALDLREYDSLTSLAAISELEAKFKDSKAKEFELFAPNHYALAKEALVDARALVTKKSPRNEIIQKVAVAEAMLRSGEVVTQKVKDLLEEQLLVKNKLDILEAKKNHQNEYGSLLARLNGVIHKIENGNVEPNEGSRITLLEDMKKLELRAIRYHALNESSEILKRIKYRSGEQLAPMTYQDALAVFQRAENFIDQYPKNEAGIRQVGKEALFAAKRALYITDQVSTLIQRVKFSMEQVVLDEEYRLYRISRGLESIDLRDNSLEKQSEQLAEFAKSRAKEYQNQEALVVSLRDTLTEVRDSSAQLAALTAFEAKQKKAENDFFTQETSLKAQINTLTEKLNVSQILLDETQQKLLAIKDENSELLLQASGLREIEKTNKEKLAMHPIHENKKTEIKEESESKLSSLMRLLKPQEENIASDDDWIDQIFVDAGDE